MSIPKIKYPFLNLKTINEKTLQAAEEAACRVIRSGWYIGGEENEAFETDLAAFTGTRYAVGTSNGLDALRLIFKAYLYLGILNPDDEVIVPSNTYIASVLAVTDAGLKPVFVEPEEGTFNLDSGKIENALTQKTKAILTVHLYGRPCFDQEMKDCAKKHNLLIIEDNAQAIGAVSKTPSDSGSFVTGSLGDAAAFSFYPTKNLGAMGDAGAVTTDDADLAKAIRALANYGTDRRYHNIYQGYNCRLDPIQAAILRAKLPFLADENNHRRALAEIYDIHVDNPFVKRPLRDIPDGSIWHQYVLRTDYREELRQYLTDKQVGTDVLYPTPPHMQPCYSCFKDLDLPIAKKLAQSVVSIPISSCTTEHDARQIARIINDFRP